MLCSGQRHGFLLPCASRQPALWGWAGLLPPGSSVSPCRSHLRLCISQVYFSFMPHVHCGSAGGLASTSPCTRSQADGVATIFIAVDCCDRRKEGLLLAISCPGSGIYHVLSQFTGCTESCGPTQAQRALSLSCEVGPASPVLPSLTILRRRGNVKGL